MVLIPGNPVVGGTVLRRAAIESPGYVKGSAGWTINQDGSAEFNNLTIRNGTIISGVALFYSGTPAAGNLIASIAATAGSDSYGNSYPAGVMSSQAGATPGQAILEDGGLSMTPGGVLAGVFVQLAAIRYKATSDAAFQANAAIYGPGTSQSVNGDWTYVGASGAPAFGTGWSNRGSGWAELAFRLLASPANDIEIRGWVSVSSTSDAVLFTLPTGYRPASEQSIIVLGPSLSVNQFNVDTGGVVQNAAATLPSTGSYYISGLISLDQ